MGRRKTPEPTEAPDSARGQTPQSERTTTDRKFAGFATWMSGGIAALTGLLAAVGTYSVGIERIVRNSPFVLFQVILGLLLALALVSIASEITPRTRIRHLRVSSVQLVRHSLFIAGAGVAFASLLGLVAAATYASGLDDRPSLNAQMAANEGGVWSVTGAASASGLVSGRSMTVLVYGVVSGSSEPFRIFYARTGPDPTGVALAEFEVPLPNREFETIVVTTSNGNLPRDCGQNRAFFAESDPTTLKQVWEGGWSAELPTTCMTFAPPPDFP